MSGERGYWENPYRVARYYNFLQNAPAEWQAPDWLDRKAIETAYKYLEYRNDGKPWHEWQPLPAEESGWLKGLPTPPPEFLMPNEQQYAPKEQAIVDPYAQYTNQKQVAWDQLLNWQQIVTGMIDTGSKIQGRPEWTRWTAAGGRAAMAGMAGGGVGALVGGAPGAVMGFLALALPTYYQELTGTEVPMIGDILQAFDIAEQKFEQLIGAGSLGVEKYGSAIKLINELPKLYKTGELKDIWDVGQYGHDVSPFTLNNAMAVLFGDQPAGPGEAWQFGQGYTEPVTIPGINYNAAIPGMTGVGQAGLEGAPELMAIYDLWTRLKAQGMTKEQIEEIINADVYDRHGMDALMNELGYGTMLDPLNFVGGVGARAGVGIGKVTGKPALSAAMKTQIGSPLIDALPFGVQQAVQGITGIKGSGSPLQGLRTYGEMLRSGTAPAGVLPDGVQIPAGELGWFDKLVGGITAEGTDKSLEPINRTFWNSLRSETPESQAARYWTNLVTGIDSLLASVDNPNLDNVARAQMVADMFNKYGGVSPVQAGDIGVNVLQSPMTASVQGGVREWLRKGVLDESLTQWINAQPKIAQLETISKTLGITVEKLIKDIADNPEATMRAIVGNPDAAGILAQFDSPGRLADAFAEFTGLKSSGETVATVPWQFDDWRARLITSLDKAAVDYSIKRYGVKEGSALYRVSNLLKSVQSLALLDFSPLYLINNVANNLVTLAYQGVLGIMSEKSMLDWQKRAGIRPLSPAQTIDMPAAMDTMAKIHETVMGDGVLSRMVRDVNRARNKIGVMSKMSRAVENSERNLAYTVGAKQIYKKTHKAGLGFRKMTPQQEAMIEAVKPGATKILYRMIENGININEIMDAVFKDIPRIIAADVVGNASQKIAKGTSLTPDIVADVLTGTGLDDVIKEKLETAQTPAEVQRAINEVEDVVQEHIDKLTEQEIVNKAGEAEARVKAEGFAAVADLYTTLQERELSRWMDNMVNMEAAATAADYGDSSAIWQRAFSDESKFWKRFEDFKALTYSGISKALGINNQWSLQFHDLMTKQNQTRRDFYDGFYERTDTGERISYADATRQNIPTRHIEGRADIWRRFWRGIYDTKEQRNVAWARATGEIADLYESMVVKEKAYQMQMDDMFGRMWGEHTGRPVTEMQEWRQAISDIRDEMVQMNRDYFSVLANVKDKAKRAELYSRRMEAAKGLVARMKHLEIAGAQDLRSRVAPDTTPPAPEPIPVTQQVSNIIDNQNIQAEAQKITNDYTARMNRRMALDQLQEVMGWDNKTRKIYGVWLDLASKQEAKARGMTPDEWVNNVLAGITKAVDDAQSNAENGLITQGGNKLLQVIYEPNKPKYIKAVDKNGNEVKVLDIKPIRGDYYDYPTSKLKELIELGGFEERINTNYTNINLSVDWGVVYVKLGNEIIGSTVKANEVKKILREALLEATKRSAYTPDDFEWGKNYGRSPDIYHDPNFLYQQYKGMTTFLDNGKALMAMTEAADHTTFFHEMFHVIFPQLQGADLEALARWGGLKDGAELQDLHSKWVDGTITDAEKARYIKAQETIAKGGEKHLMEGSESIPPEYRSVFAKIQEWFIEVYKSLKDAFADIDLQAVIEFDGKRIKVKDIYDRMLFDTQVQADNTQSIMTMAKELGIPTATKTGKPNNRQLLNIINNNADVKYKKIGDVPPEVARQAIELHVQGWTMNEQPTLFQNITNNKWEVGETDFLKNGIAYWIKPDGNIIDVVAGKYGQHVKALADAVDNGDIDISRSTLNDLYDDSIKALFDVASDGIIRVIGNVDNGRLTDLGLDLPAMSKQKALKTFQKYVDNDLLPYDLDANVVINLIESDGNITDIRGKFAELLQGETKQLFQSIPIPEQIASLIAQGKDAVVKAIRDEGDRTVRQDMLDELERQNPGMMKEIHAELSQDVEAPQPQPFGDVIPGRTPVTLDRGEMLSEVAQEHIKPLLSAIREEAIASLNKKQVSFADLPDDLIAEVRKYLDTTVRSDMASEKLLAQRNGEQMRDLAMLNYSKRYGFDNVLDMVFPYQFWYTRTMMNWAMRMIEKPVWFSMYARIREAQRKYESKGIPTRLRGKMRMATPYMPDWAGGSVYFDPLRQLFPFDQFGQPLESMRMMQSQNTQDAIDILRSQKEEGSITAEEYTQALETKTGYIWERAIAKAQKDDDDNTPASLVSMMMSPNLFWTMGKNIINKTPEKIGTMPFTRLGQGLESALQGTPLEAIGKYAGGALAWPERKIREAAGLSEFGEWGDYYVDRMLSNMAADGTYDADTILRAMMEKTGPAYEEAYNRVQQEVSLRMPGMLPIYAAKGGGSIGEIGTALLASMFPASMYPEGEKRQRDLRYDYDAMWDKYNAGDKAAYGEFFDTSPEYAARLALYDEPEDRLRTFLKDEVWNRYMELDRYNQDYAEQQFGEMFTDAFLNKETRDYTAIPIQTMAWWAQMLGAALPKVPEVQNVPQGQIETYPAEVVDPLTQYYDERDKLFPGMSAVESLYYDSGKDKGVLKQFPELRDFWDWKRKYKAEHPEVQPAIDTVYPESMFGGDRNAIEKSQQILTPEQLSQFDDALIRQLFGQYIANQELTYGAKTELMRLWESQGKPGGTFEYYVEEVVRKSLAIP